MVRDPESPVSQFYEGWATYNERIIEVLGDLTAEQLEIRPEPEGWPIWATVGHTAGARVYWLCGVLGEPGAEATPFPDTLSGVGWEDDLDSPRTATELTDALATTWQVIADCLQRWTPGLLLEPLASQAGKKTQIKTRQSVLMRLISHDAYHCGQLSQTLGIHRLPQIDLWRAD